MMGNNDDSWFVRMSDLRNEIEENVFPVVEDVLKRIVEEERKFIVEYVDGKIRDMIDINKLAAMITKMDDRIKLLEMEKSETKKMEE